MTDKATHTPLPCPNPWCCSTSTSLPVALKREGWRVICACGVATYRCKTEAEALTAWNTRAVNSHHDLIEALEALLNSSGARGVYHASKHFDAVEAAENLLAALKEAGHG